LADHESCQRTYALNDEAGLILCSWPNGGRPRYPFPYADEVWTGIEYQVAAHLIYEGMVDEGLAVVEAIRARHDGSRRSPWDEFECGHHYARALASWSVLLALSGYHYSAPSEQIAFEPRINHDNFRCFFSTGNAWGSFAQSTHESGMSSSIAVREGQLPLRRVRLSLPGHSSLDGIVAESWIGDIFLPSRAVANESIVTIELEQTITLSPAHSLSIRLARQGR
jgi:hypothetical protein